MQLTWQMGIIYFLFRKDIWHQKHTHKQRFVSVSPVATCRSSVLPSPPTWRVFVLPPKGFVYTAGESIFIFTLSLPSSSCLPASLSPSLPPYFAPLLIRKRPWPLHKESLFCRSCGDGGERWGAFIARCLKSCLWQTQPPKCCTFQENKTLEFHGEIRPRWKVRGRLQMYTEYVHIIPVYIYIKSCMKCSESHC